MQTLRSQELTPRAYVITPINTNTISLADTYLQGSYNFNGAVPVTGAKADIELPALGLYHSLDFLGRAANVAVVVPYGTGDFTGTVADVPKFAHRDGFLDSVVRWSVNLIGGPAMTPAQYARWQQDVLLGASLQVVLPTGQYDPTRLINYGSNRWQFKPEVGYSQRFGHWILDVYAAGWFFTTNPAFYPGRISRSEAPVGELQTHLSYTLMPRLWLSLDANFWSGGTTSSNGVLNPLTYQKNSRAGITASLPLTVHQSIKLSYSRGAFIGYGGNYDTVSLTWQYGWFGFRPP